MSVAEEIKDRAADLTGKASELTEVLELRLAAQQGYIRSQFVLAIKLATGDGVEKNL